MLALPRLGLGLGLLLSVWSCGQGTGNTNSWYYTCGDPACRGYSPRLGVPLCTDSEAGGQPCANPAQQCDPIDNCNRLLLCASQDPRTQLDGGCPR